MAGTGTHLHRLIKQFTGFDYTPSCSCKETVRQMDSNPPQWSRDNFEHIRGKLRGELKNRGWWGKLLANVPGNRAPVYWMVHEAARRAEADIDAEAKSVVESAPEDNSGRVADQ